MLSLEVLDSCLVALVLLSVIPVMLSLLTLNRLLVPLSHGLDLRSVPGILSLHLFVLPLTLTVVLSLLKVFIPLSLLALLDHELLLVSQVLVLLFDNFVVSPLLVIKLLQVSLGCLSSNSLLLLNLVL